LPHKGDYQKLKFLTTFNGGSLGSCIDEERSKLRYVMWIAEFSESSNFRTQMAPQGSLCSMSVWVSEHPLLVFILRNKDWGSLRCWLEAWKDILVSFFSSSFGHCWFEFWLTLLSPRKKNITHWIYIKVRVTNHPFKFKIGGNKKHLWGQKKKKRIQWTN